jgi:hypothetical protein
MMMLSIAVKSDKHIRRVELPVDVIESPTLQKQLYVGHWIIVACLCHHIQTLIRTAGVKL